MNDRSEASYERYAMEVYEAEMLAYDHPELNPDYLNEMPEALWDAQAADYANGNL